MMGSQSRFRALQRRLVISEPKSELVPVFMVGTAFCKAVSPSGELSLDRCGVQVPPPAGIELPPGSFGVGINVDCDDDLHYGWDWPTLDRLDGQVAIFEPMHGPVRIGETYLHGEYDAKNGRLESATVQEVGAIIQDRGIDRVVFRDGEELDFDYVPAMKDLLFLGCLVHPELPEKPKAQPEHIEAVSQE